MLIKSFFGASMTEAMQKAAKQLGDDALILNSRETPADLRGHGRFEVVATVAYSDAATVRQLFAEEAAPPLPEAGRNTAPADALDAPVIPVSRVPADPQIHLLTGLPGSGKTTCALKLAVKYGVWQARRTAILHFDTNRIARRESLEWYCRAAGIQCLTGHELPPAALEPFEYLVVDTSALDLQEGPPELLTRLLDAPHYSAHLVAPAWASASYFDAAQQRVRLLGVQFLLPTFLDEALLAEDAAAAAAKLDLGVSYLSAGGKVPAGLWESSEAQLANFAEERIAPSRNNGEQNADTSFRNRAAAHAVPKAHAAASEMVA